MTRLTQLEDERIRRVLSLRGDDAAWKRDLERLEAGDASLTRASAGEDAIAAVQRLLVFLGYSTASTGAFLIDGDFGRGTNRGVAQFQFEHGLTREVDRETLCYDCVFQNAAKLIVTIPDVRLDVPTLDRMLTVAGEKIEAGEVTFGRFEDALFQLNSLHQRKLLDCKGILQRYGDAADAAVARLAEERGIEIGKEWILAIIRQETAGVARPRFEQHKLSAAHRKHPGADFAELRHQSMSLGLGQIMGFNHELVGAPSARAMISSPVEEQILYVARFLAPKKDILAKREPSMDDFRAIARFYNGPAYESHHYHERLETWFREFRRLL